MKRFALVLAASVLLPAAVAAQAPTNNPNPVAPGDTLWNRVMELPRGQPIVVVSTYGPPLHCRFAGATDAFLFCDPPDALPDTTEGYRFDRASILNVTVARRPFIKHPVVLASAVMAGVVLGLGSTQSLSDRDAATVGMISGLAVGAVGIGISQGPIYGPGFGFSIHPRGFGFLSRPILHRFAPDSPIRFHEEGDTMHKRLEMLLSLILPSLLTAQSVVASTPDVNGQSTTRTAANARTSTISTVTIPKNTEIKLVLLDPLSSATARRGDSVHFAVAKDVIVDGITILPEGRLVLGRIATARPAVPNKRDGVLKYTLTPIPLEEQKSLPVTDHPSSISRKGKTSACTADQMCVMTQPIAKKPVANHRRKAGDVAKAIMTAPLLIPLSLILVPLMAIAMWHEGGPPNGTNVEMGICSERSFYVKSAKTIRVTDLQPLAQSVGIANASCRPEIPPTL